MSCEWRRAPRGCSASWLVLPPLTVLVGCGIAWGAGLRANLTESLPVGVYQVLKAAPMGVPERGAIVLACLPACVARFARDRGYVPPGSCTGAVAAVGKHVAAVPGDTVSVTPSGISVNGSLLPNSRRLTRDSRGRPLPHVGDGSYVVRPGEVWLISRNSPRSYDSRYFGPVPSAALHAVIRDIFTLPVATTRGA